MATTDVWRYRGLVGILAERELKLRYKRSVLGWLWSLINPASLLLVYTVVFGVFLRVEPPIGGNGELESFALFLFCGLVVWNLFSAVVPGCMAWLLGAAGLLNKVHFPAEAPLFAGALSVMVQSGTEALILLTAMLIVGNISWTFLFVPPVLALVALFAIGLGFIAAVINVYFRDMLHVVPIGLTLLFFATPIVYPFSIVPEKMWGNVPVQDLIRLNPLTHFVGTIRDLVYDLRLPGLDRMTVLTIISLLTFAAGWWLFRRFAPRLPEEL